MFDRIHLPMDSLFAKGVDDQENPLGWLRELFVVMLKGASSKRQDQRELNIINHRCKFTDEMSTVVARYRTMGRKEGPAPSTCTGTQKRSRMPIWTCSA